MLHLALLRPLFPSWCTKAAALLSACTRLTSRAAQIIICPLSSIDDGSCNTPIVFGCTDSTAFYYDTRAHHDDGSCSPMPWHLPGFADAVVTLYDSYGDGWIGGFLMGMIALALLDPLILSI